MKLNDTGLAMPPQQVTLDVLLEKYAKGGEKNVEDVRRRVARALAAVEKDPAHWEPVFYAALESGFIPGGRVNSAAGTSLQATLINCFVQPVGDSVSETVDGRPGIYVALMESAETMRRGGGVGYDFSAIRPKGARVRGTDSTASGPVSYMRVFDKSCETVESAGSRRGAQMGILRCDHPDIEDFVHAKDHGELKNFNVSVAVTDAFMRAVESDGGWELVHKQPPAPDFDGESRQRADGLWVYRSLPARELWRQIMESTYDHAEPGVFFVDRAYTDNNLSYVERIEATNPCVTADTRLHTQYGLATIGDLNSAAAPLQATVDVRALGQGDRGVTIRSAAPAFMTSRSADVFRVETLDGYEIKATAWHDFYTTRGKIRLKDLQPGDELLVQSGKGQFGKEGSDEIGFLIGLIAGDGHFTNRGKGKEAAIINFWGEDRSFAPAVASQVNSAIAGLALKRRVYQVTPTVVPGRTHVFVRSVLLARFLEHYGFTGATKLRVPEIVWRGTEDCVKGYLRGLFQTDGTVNISGESLSCSIRLASSEPKLLNDIQVLLANFGIFCRIRKRREAGTRFFPDGKGGQKLYDCRVNYELIIDGESRERFMQEIGFHSETKNAKYREWAKDKVLRKSQSFLTKVTAITHVGREAVYDTTQADRNTVIFNGLVTGQCGEQPLPPYGCCCLGSVNLTPFVRDPFGAKARFDFDAFGKVVRPAVRMLDNVLEATVWPLKQQQEEARAKRRVGLGFTGLGDALIMLGLRYDTEEARRMAAKISETMRDEAYAASIELAREKGAFPMFDAAQYLAAPRFAARLPEKLKSEIRKHGIRNSHLLSIAPTGTISLAFADNASNGVEPPFSWTYQRKKRMADGSMKTYDVEDHAWRLYRNLGGAMDQLPPAFVTAMDISALDHMRMVAVVAPYVDSAISKTVNVPEDYPYEQFRDLYLEAWKAGLKGITTYRPNKVLGAVLSLAPAPAPEAEQPNDLDTSADRRIRLEAAPQPALSSLRWPGRPKLAAGNPSWTYMVESPFGQFAIFVGHVENADPHPFEVWVNGAEQPRGLGAVAKTLSMDMRAQDRAWLRMKLEILARTAGDDAFDCPMPPYGELQRVPSLVAAFARIVRYRVDELGALARRDGPSPVLDALFAKKEPKTGTGGTLSWTADVHNPRAGDDFVLILKELQLPGGQRRPYSVWMAGEYPRALDGLCKLLSLDMRVIDPAWIGMKLRKLLNYGEPLGDFMARVPGENRQQNFPSTLAYVARLIIHRFAMLGVLDERGYPVNEMGVLEIPEDDRVQARAPSYRALHGRKCLECGNSAVIHKDGCEFCTACGAIGACG